METQERERTEAPVRGRAERADVFAVIKREGLDKPLWQKVGVGFKNRDGSINLLFDFFPRDPDTGLQLRWVEVDEEHD